MTNIEDLDENLSSSEEYVRYLPVLKGFEEWNFEILIQTQKI